MIYFLHSGGSEGEVTLKETPFLSRDTEFSKTSYKTLTTSIFLFKLPNLCCSYSAHQVREHKSIKKFKFLPVTNCKSLLYSVNSLVTSMSDRELVSDVFWKKAHQDRYGTHQSGSEFSLIKELK